jgi:hypothetical protein
MPMENPGKKDQKWQRISFDISSRSAGIYFVRIKNEERFLLLKSSNSNWCSK